VYCILPCYIGIGNIFAIGGNKVVRVVSLGARAKTGKTDKCALDDIPVANGHPYSTCW
jgi:hypothetical protein